jgi:DcaP outer membrane protein
MYRSAYLTPRRNALNIIKLVLTMTLFATATASGQNAVRLEGPEFDMQRPTAELYGFAMADVGYNAGRIDPDWFDVMRPSKLPSFENQFGEDGETWFGVRQSRFGIKFWQPTAKHDLRGIFEVELFGVGNDAGQTTFRVRHAYLQYNKFGAGQYHSVFMDMDIFPDSIEYWGPPGMILFRNVQVRYMPVMGDRHNVAISLERPGASGDVGRYDDFVAARAGLNARFPLPDLAAHYRYSDEWGHVQLAGILRRIEVDDTTGDAFDLSDQWTGWGLNLTTKFNLGRGTVKGGFVYGEGIETYMNDATPDIAVLPNPIDPNDPGLPPGGAAMIPVLSASLFYDVAWSDRFTSTFGFSFQDRDLDGMAVLPDAFKSGQYALLNLIYYPVRELMTAVELQYGRRQNFSDGWEYDAWRIQFSAKYRFSFRLGDKP